MHPLRPHDRDDAPPPRREQLPLPRRSQQRHLEPQLREPGGGGEGTPFAPFTTGQDHEPEALPPARDAAAEFHAGTERARAGGRNASGSDRRS